MDSKIGFEMSFIVVEATYVDDGEFHDTNGNGFGDIWWTDKLIYFSSMPYRLAKPRSETDTHTYTPGLLE